MSDEKLEQEATGLRKAHDDMKEQLGSLKAQYSQLLASTSFEKAGLNPKHAELFLKVNGDEPITAESITKFVEDYSLTVAVPAGEVAPVTPPAAPANTNLASLSGAGIPPAGVGGTIPQGAKMGQAEFQKLYSNDKASALKAYTEGRVEHAEGNPLVAEAVQKGLISR